MATEPILLDAPGACWRVETAPRAAFILDIADYLAAAKAAMLGAQRSIHFLNWAFDPGTLLEPGPGGAGPKSDRIGAFLKDLVKARPQLDIRILCWRSALPVAATQNFFPIKARIAFHGSPVKFVLDGKLPFGAAHHQKMIVIDDAVAFCGGGDIAPDRWDTCDHIDDDPRRRKGPSSDKCFDARHEVMALVDGPAAQALGQLFRDRWTRCTDEALEPPPTSPTSPSAPWPPGVTPDFHEVPVGISRTVAKWRGDVEVRESEMLYLAQIAGARRSIYLENEYFTSPVMAAALADRLAEADGPEVILISARHSPSYFDQMTMDRTRSMFIKTLEEADRHGRLRALAPVTAGGRILIVHAKLAIVDDGLLRVGSSNMNNRSSGFDTECDVTIEAAGATAEATRARIAAIRTHLVAHWLGCADGEVTSALAQAGSLGAAIDFLGLAGHDRLRPIHPQPLSPLARIVAAFHLGDPAGPDDSWRPWRRAAALEANAAAGRRRSECLVASDDIEAPWREPA